MSSILRATTAVALIAICLAQPAFADDLTGAYVGGGVGEGRVAAGTAGLAPPGIGNFNQTHLGYHLDFGIHPAGAPVALELEYLDLGEPHLPPYSGPGFLHGSVSQRGEGLFLLFFLPTPIVQLYAKTGASHITTHADYTYCAVDSCVVATLDPTNTAFAFGGGLQWTLGPWTVRGEYERFNAGGGHPSLLTIGVEWAFL